jgi:hypothetical protein
MTAELQRKFDKLAVHVRVRLEGEARKIALNNNADYDKTLEAHFGFYLATQAKIWGSAQ